MTDLERRRAERWWLTKPKVTSITRAAAFIDDVGFCLLWPTRKQALPALWDIGSDRDRDDNGEFEFGEDAERMWGWKDELPKRGLAWYGHFIRGNKSFLSRALLNALYPREGSPSDHKTLELSPLARRIADIIDASGPQSAAALREATDTRGAPFDRALKELGRALVITHLGVEEQGAGWPSAMLELTARAFDIAPSFDRVAVAKAFVGTMLECKPNELARAFGWNAADARHALRSAAADGFATREGDVFSVARPHRRQARTPRTRSRS